MEAFSDSKRHELIQNTSCLNSFLHKYTQTTQIEYSLPQSNGDKPQTITRTYVIYFSWDWVRLDRLHGLVVRASGYRTEMYCVSCEVRTEFICYVEESIIGGKDRGKEITRKTKT
jgi:hypothetical protein